MNGTDLLTAVVTGKALGIDFQGDGKATEPTKQRSAAADRIREQLLASASGDPSTEKIGAPADVVDIETREHIEVAVEEEPAVAGDESVQAPQAGEPEGGKKPRHRQRDDK
jgi:preprotein translocase subunit SecF